MIAALMVAAGIFSQTIDVTFDMLVATPSRFDGSTVRLSGQIDSCWNFSCAICPKEATPLTVDRSKCLAIEFERGQPLLSKPIRYSDVTVTARFDPSCMLRPGACTDNGAVLDNATVEAISRRRQSNEGLISGGTPLQPASAAVENEVSQLVRQKHETRIHGDLKVRIFTTADDVAGGDSAVACWSSVESGWPTTWDQAILMRSSVDPWRCTEVTKRDGQWALRRWSADRAPPPLNPHAEPVFEVRPCSRTTLCVAASRRRVPPEAGKVKMEAVLEQDLASKYHPIMRFAGGVALGGLIIGCGQLNCSGAIRRDRAA